MLHGLGFPDHLLAVDLLLELAVLLDYADLVGSVLDCDQDPVQVEGLLYEIERAFLDAFHGGFNVAMAGDHYHGGVYAVSYQFLQDFRPIHTRHLDVAENNVEPFLIHLGECGRPVLGDIHFITLVAQDLFQRIPDGPFVVNNQNLHTTNIV